MLKTTLTTIVRAIEMFRVANGMVLMMVVEAFDGGGSGVDRRENLAKISDPTLWEEEVVIQMANNKDKKNNHDNMDNTESKDMETNHGESCKTTRHDPA